MDSVSCKRGLNTSFVLTKLDRVAGFDIMSLTE